MDRLAREPAALWIGLIAPLAAVLTAFVFGADPVTQGVVNAAVVAVAGAATAVAVRSDRQLPAITGAVQALIAVVAAFGLDWTSEQQASLMVATGAVAAILVRDRVTAPVPPVAV